MPPRMTTDNFIKRATQRWGSRWDYSNTQYTGSKKTILIGCPEHGEFEQVAASHLSGFLGCPGCNGRHISTADFIERAKEVWGDRWDYQLSKYSTSHDSITIACLDHGPFQTTPLLHLRGSGGCPVCADGRRMQSEDFFREVENVWGDRWGTDRVEFINTTTPVTLTCYLHGDFEQTPKQLLRGTVGCPPCNKRTSEGFSLRAREVWGDRWDYNDEYNGANSKVTITCPTHGAFKQRAENHIRGYVGCRSCGVQTSGGEISLGDFLESQGLPMVRGDRETLGGQEIDFLFPSLNIGIEFNGVYFHSEKFKDKNYHYNKFRSAQAAGIRLLQVWEDDWRLRRKIVEEHLKTVLGTSNNPKVGARKLKIVEVGPSEAREFLNAHHIQGFVGASVYCAGIFDGEIVALASFKRRSKGYELSRYATSVNVQGGHSRIVSYFERTYNPESLCTFADLTFSDGGLYRNTGWREDKLLPPDYSYLRSGVRQHKFSYRITRFRNDPSLEFVDGASERELAAMNSLLRVYDAGKIRFVR